MAWRRPRGQVGTAKALRTVRVERYSTTDRDEWNRFVRDSKNGTFLLTRDYMDYHAERFFDYSLLVRDEDDRLAAILPAHSVAERLISHGGLTYGGFVMDARMTTSRMLDSR